MALFWQIRYKQIGLPRKVVKGHRLWSRNLLPFPCLSPFFLVFLDVMPEGAAATLGACGRRPHAKDGTVSRRKVPVPGGLELLPHGIFTFIIYWVRNYLHFIVRLGISSYVYCLMFYFLFIFLCKTPEFIKDFSLSQLSFLF